MDKLQQHITKLEGKIDRLYEIVEGIRIQLTLLNGEKGKKKQKPQQSLSVSDSVLSVGDEDPKFPSLLDYKDTMVGGSEGQPSDNSIEQSLAPETQIRRLTAQLTAAYNRIAALEEQLLATRIHSQETHNAAFRSNGTH